MYRHSRTLSTLLGLSSWTKRPCKHLLTAFFAIILLTQSLRCNPVPCIQVQIRSQNFSERIRNPCRGTEVSPLSDYNEEEIDIYRRGLLSDIKDNLNSTRKDAEKLLNENVDSVCRSGYLPNAVTANSFQNRDREEVLLDIYDSLLAQISGVYYAHQQDANDKDSTCASVRNNHSTFASRLEILGGGLTEITCLLQSVLLSYSVEESVLSSHSDSVLDMVVCDNGQCSTRILRDCDTIKRTSALLDAIGSYLNQQS